MRHPQQAAQIPLKRTSGRQESKPILVRRTYGTMSETTSEEMREATSRQPIAKRILAYWRTYVVILIPLIFMPLPIALPSLKMNCAYIMIIMAAYWVTEALPLAVTSLLPVVLVPLLGIMSSKDLCPNYTKDTILLFMGGLMVAVCVEHWNLHKRIAIKVLVWVGTAPRWLMLGFMLPTWFLSMWISNTATTAMMIPIVAAVLEEMRGGQKAAERMSISGDQYSSNMSVSQPGDDASHSGLNMSRSSLRSRSSSVSPSNEKTAVKVMTTNIDESETLVMENRAYSSSEKNSFKTNSSTGQDVSAEDKAYQNLCKAMSLSVAYAANSGGIATLTGTGPNLVLKGQLDILFGEEVGVSFSSWMVFAFPISLISLFVSWVWLQMLYLGCLSTFRDCCKKQKTDAAIKKIIREEYEALGPWSFAEISILCIFSTLAILWFTRSPGFMPGWGDLFPTGYATDATAAMAIAILLFIFPSQLPRCWGGGPRAPVPALLSWETITHKLPWNIVLLLGGGFALADASQVSGLSEWVGEQLVVLKVFPSVVIVLLISTIIAGLTEVTSNTATATLMLPIIADLATNLNVNPLFLMLPATVSASFAFMLPVATPPNAIVFSYGHLRIRDMVLAGCVMNIMCILIVTLGVSTWGTAFFSLDTFPDWAWHNETEIATTVLPNCTFY
ncbi:Na(+)/citrate cotransporter-like isoform X2 [Lineus longissimus]|uniref:Na(+)/citrate cotransporter-like isoform X2 n=1 Tax=Lineus longissimus TaxID=88925 RepID=UPI00315D95FF